MGVRTSSWGPHAWRALHALARLMGDDKRWTPVFELLPSVLPCVHCRRSFGEFYPLLRARTDAGDGGHGEYWERFAYLAHSQVNLKLYRQDHHQGKLDKWRDYCPERAARLPEKEWVGSLFMLMYYVQLDWNQERADNITEWITEVLELLGTRHDWARLAADQWFKARPGFAAETTRERFKAVRRMQHYSPCPTDSCAAIRAFCSKSVVGCVMPEPKQRSKGRAAPKGRAGGARGKGAAR